MDLSFRGNVVSDNESILLTCAASMALVSITRAGRLCACLCRRHAGSRFQRVNLHGLTFFSFFRACLANPVGPVSLCPEMPTGFAERSIKGHLAAWLCEAAASHRLLLNATDVPVKAMVLRRSWDHDILCTCDACKTLVCRHALDVCCGRAVLGHTVPPGSASYYPCAGPVGGFAFVRAGGCRFRRSPILRQTQFPGFPGKAFSHRDVPRQKLAQLAQLPMGPWAVDIYDEANGTVRLWESWAQLGSRFPCTYIVG